MWLWFSFWSLWIRTVNMEPLLRMWLLGGTFSHLNTERLGAWDILGLPLLAASVTMEIAPMAGKTWASMPWQDRHLSHWYTVESRVWGREGTMTTKHSTCNAATSATLINKCYSPKHVEFHTQASISKPPTNNWPQSFLVVYLVKLHLISFANSNTNVDPW